MIAQTAKTEASTTPSRPTLALPVVENKAMVQVQASLDC